jgi:ribosomal protein S18 acetylase RimI-like enzyme
VKPISDTAIAIVRCCLLDGRDGFEIANLTRRLFGATKLLPVLVRLAEPKDVAEVADVHVRAWQVGYKGLVPDEYLDGLRPEERAKHYTFGDPDPSQPITIVAVERGAICGFATIGSARDADVQTSGELYALYVEPAGWGRGVGRALVTAAREQLARRGFTAAVLWVLVGNERAARFYRIDGWLPDGSRRLIQVWGLTVDEVRYRRVLT